TRPRQRLRGDPYASPAIHYLHPPIFVPLVDRAVVGHTLPTPRRRPPGRARRMHSRRMRTRCGLPAKGRREPPPEQVVTSRRTVINVRSKEGIMILPNVRSSLGRDDVALLIGLLSQGDPRAREREEARVREEGLDAVLDDPRTLNALLGSDGISRIPSRLVFYLLVRHSLLEAGVESAAAADYLAAMLLEFGQSQRAYRPTEDWKETYRCLVDIVAALESAKGREAFLLRAHLGNFALWLSGLSPDHITARVNRRGAPGLRYYEEMGATGYRLAADCRDAEDWWLDVLYP